MSRIQTIGATIAALLAGVGAATAADVPPYAAPPSTASYYSPPPAFTWTGAYIGVLGGYGFGGTTVSNDGGIGGGYIGVNRQLGSNLVFGVEGDVTITGKSGTSGTTTVSNPWNATLRGRLGYVMDRFMIYGTAGVAAGHVDVDDTVGPTSESTNEVGWTAGVGVEAALSQHIVGRAEYRYTNLGSATYTPGTISYSSNDLMVGIGFKF